MMRRIYPWLAEHWPYLTVLAAVLAPLFASRGYLFFTDMAWGPRMDVNWADPWFFRDVLARGLGVLLPADFVEKLFIVGSLALVLYGTKVFVERFVFGRWPVFLVSLFGLFNPYVYDRILFGQFGVVIAFGLLMAGAGLLLQYLATPIRSRIVAAGVCWAFAVQFSPHFIFFTGAFFVIVFVPAYLVGAHRTGHDIRVPLRRLAMLAAVLAVCGAGLNAHWIIGSALGKNKTGALVQQGISRKDFEAFRTLGDGAGGALTNVLLMSGFWGEDRHYYIDLQMIGHWGRTFSFLVPLILWGAYRMLRSRERSERLLAFTLSIVFVLAVILAAGLGTPPGRIITYWLVDHLPFYKGLRETQKWGALVVLVYSAFLAVGLREWMKRRFAQQHAWAIYVWVGSASLLLTFPLLWGFQGQVPIVPYPDAMAQADRHIVDTTACRGNTLVLPWHMYMSFTWIQRLVVNPSAVFFTCPVLVGNNIEWGGIYDNSNDSVGTAVDAWIRSAGKTDLLRDESLDIRYVLVYKEVDWRRFDWLDHIADVRSVMDSEFLRLYAVTP